LLLAGFLCNELKLLMPATTLIPARFLRKDDQKPRFTGKQLVLLNSAATTKTITSQAKKSSLRLASTADFSKSRTGDFLTQALVQADGIVFEKLKVAIINEALEDPMRHLMAASSTARNFLHTEAERFVYALAGSKKKKSTPFTDNSSATWALQAVNVLKSKYSGKGIRVAVLDTGIDTGHPDLKSRIRGKKTFVSGQQVMDRNGHGTHCSGLVAGLHHPTRKFRYGVAPDAQLYIGKVLSNDGVGTDSSILAGMEWALEQKCRIISMSLGGAVEPGEKYSSVYESVAREALKQNCLIIAAAGNESERSQNNIAPVGHPANCPSIFAVGSLSASLSISDFSCGGLNSDGGQVDIAAPGENIWSTWKNNGYRRESGTSMATPIVAGLAALILQADPGASAAALWMRLNQDAKRLPLPASDCGAGLAYSRH
jgi:subtilisin family serine protease